MKKSIFLGLLLNVILMNSGFAWALGGGNGGCGSACVGGYGERLMPQRQPQRYVLLATLLVSSAALKAASAGYLYSRTSLFSNAVSAAEAAHCPPGDASCEEIIDPIEKSGKSELLTDKLKTGAFGNAWTIVSQSVSAGSDSILALSLYRYLPLNINVMVLTSGLGNLVVGGAGTVLGTALTLGNVKDVFSQINQWMAFGNTTGTVLPLQTTLDWVEQLNDGAVIVLVASGAVLATNLVLPFLPWIASGIASGVTAGLVAGNTGEIAESLAERGAAEP